MRHYTCDIINIIICSVSNVYIEYGMYRRRRTDSDDGNRSKFHTIIYVILRRLRNHITVFNKIYYTWRHQLCSTFIDLTYLFIYYDIVDFRSNLLFDIMIIVSYIPFYLIGSYYSVVFLADMQLFKMYRNL